MSGTNNGGNGPIVTIERILQVISALGVMYISWVYAADYAEHHGGSIIPKFETQGIAQK